ncbi:MAG: riboflavin synthase [Candidatus Omnitrophica bacterium]|nr:riboflavin synthase [Candidatus Omnitrophota bacterium]MDD5488662.1 riboflavin synthase [Candidatus Omnitrophota bacterium]
MFTGIVQTIGKVKSVLERKGTYHLRVDAGKKHDDVDIGGSIAVNGVCLTLVSRSSALSFDVIGRTFETTNLKRLRPGDKVNLEPALKAGDMVSGHFVSGHIDGERKVLSVGKTLRGVEVEIGLEPEDRRFVVPKGSVALDGISLTIGEILKNSFKVFIIPHTLGNTTLNMVKKGYTVNVEFDMLMKKDMTRPEHAGPAKGKITWGKLAENGFI